MIKYVEVGELPFLLSVKKGAYKESQRSGMVGCSLVTAFPRIVKIASEISTVHLSGQGEASMAREDLNDPKTKPQRTASSRRPASWTAIEDHFNETLRRIARPGQKKPADDD